MKKQLRPLGKITAELEPLLFEMTEDHDMQFHEILGILYLWAKVHAPHCIETYEDDGAEPRLNYGK